MSVKTGSTNHRTIALVLSALFAGLGQFYNRQFVKGFFFLIIEAAYLYAFSEFISLGLWGIITLGEKLPRDHSIFLLVNGIIALLVIAIGLAVYALNIYDAYQNGKKRDTGLRLHSIREQYHNLIDSGFPYLMISPGFLLLIFVVVFPLLFMFLLAFTNYDLYHSPPAKLVEWIGFGNFINIFQLEIWRTTLLSVLSWTIIWTLVATTGQIVIGIFLAVLLNQKDLKGRGFIRTVLILSWAVPAFVSILIFSSMFNETFGVINSGVLKFFGVEGISWMTNPYWTRVALILMQIWLGFPFIMAMTTGVLQSIPDDLYEAASIDGASIWQKFRNITLPMILYATAPILITQYTFNFNNFNIIYLFNKGGPALPGQTAGGTDILISWIYKLTLTSSQYSIAAALTVILSILVMSFALYFFRKTQSFKEEDLI